VYVCVCVCVCFTCSWCKKKGTAWGPQSHSTLSYKLVPAVSSSCLKSCMSSPPLFCHPTKLQLKIEDISLVAGQWRSQSEIECAKESDLSWMEDGEDLAASLCSNKWNNIMYSYLIKLSTCHAASTTTFRLMQPRFAHYVFAVMPTLRMTSLESGQIGRHGRFFGKEVGFEASGGWGIQIMLEQQNGNSLWNIFGWLALSLPLSR